VVNTAIGHRRIDAVPREREDLPVGR
jgi:hypothetical protein